MRYINKLTVRVFAAIVAGVLIAGMLTHITYPCAIMKGYFSCNSYEKAVMHPADLLKNKQDSLVRFSKTFAVTSLVSFGLLTAISLPQKKKSQPITRHNL